MLLVRRLDLSRFGPWREFEARDFVFRGLPELRRPGAFKFFAVDIRRYEDSIRGEGLFCTHVHQGRDGTFGGWRKWDESAFGDKYPPGGRHE